MHRAHLFIATMLLGAASLAVAALAMSIPHADVTASDSSSQGQVVRRFYDAVNLQIKTGDSTALLDILHPDFIDEHPLPRVSPGPEGLVEYVHSLHVQFPAASIEIESILAHEDEVVVISRAHLKEESEAMNARFEIRSSIWNSPERFRIAGNQIIERDSPNRGLAMLQERFDVSLRLDADQPRTFQATHLAFVKSGSARLQTTAGPALLHVISGELAITVTTSLDESGPRRPTIVESAFGHHRPLSQGEVNALPEGTTLTIPAGHSFTAISPSGPVLALYLSATRTSPLGPGITGVASSSAGLTLRDLGPVAMNIVSPGVVKLTLHRIALTPAASISRANETASRPPLVWLDSGTVLTESVITASDPASPNRQFISGVHLNPDVGFAYLWGHGATLHNLSNEPALLWALSVEPGA